MSSREPEPIERCRVCRELVDECGCEPWSDAFVKDSQPDCDDCIDRRLHRTHKPNGYVAAQEAPAPDAGNRDRNHYDWFMPENPTAAVDEYLDDFEAKCREGLTDPFMHDMSQAVLPLIAAYRQSRAAQEATEPRLSGLDYHRAVLAARKFEGALFEAIELTGDTE